MFFLLLFIKNFFNSICWAFFRLHLTINNYSTDLADLSLPMCPHWYQWTSGYIYRYRIKAVGNPYKLFFGMVILYIVDIAKLAQSSCGKRLDVLAHSRTLPQKMTMIQQNYYKWRLLRYGGYLLNGTLFLNNALIKVSK